MKPSKTFLRVITGIAAVLAFLANMDGAISMINRFIIISPIMLHHLRVFFELVGVPAFAYLLWWVITTVTRVEKKVAENEQAIEEEHEITLIMYYDLKYRVENSYGNRAVDNVLIKAVLSNMLGVAKGASGMQIKESVAKYYCLEVGQLPI